MFVILFGLPLEEQTLVGPFETYEDACVYADDACNENSFIVELNPPSRDCDE